MLWNKQSQWKLSFFKGLRNEIIKSGENALGDFDANSQIWKTYMENREDYQYLLSDRKQKQCYLSDSLHFKLIFHDLISNSFYYHLSMLEPWFLTMQLLTLIYVNVTLWLKDEFMWHINLTFAYSDPILAVSSTLNHDQVFIRNATHSRYT